MIKNGLRWFGEEFPAETFAKGGNSDEHQEVSSSIVNFILPRRVEFSHCQKSQN
jgi:hypothetical protein